MRRHEATPKFAIGPVLVALGMVDTLRGGGRTPVRCPFHDDGSPSATVDESNGWFHCFSCGIHEDAIGLLMMFPERWSSGGQVDFNRAKQEAEKLSAGVSSPVLGATGNMLDWF